jgi:hypothetical protein
MTSYHFFERMEREIGFHNEYEKIENIICNEDLDGHRYSLNSWISLN